MPHKRFPSPATMARSAIKTGVEQGEEKMPPRIPARNAPIIPLRLFFPTRFTEGMKLKIPKVCKDISTISTPRMMYHTGEDVPISLPAEVAIMPIVTKVKAVPSENTAE